MIVIVDLLGLKELIGYGLTQAGILLVNFFLARHWIFQHKHKNVGEQMLQFGISAVFFRCLNWLCYLLLWGYWGMQREYAAFFALLALYPFKFLTHKLLVFNPSKS